MLKFRNPDSDGEGVQRRRGGGTQTDSKSPILLSEACVDC